MSLRVGLFDSQNEVESFPTVLLLVFSLSHTNLTKGPAYTASVRAPRPSGDGCVGSTESAQEGIGRIAYLLLSINYNIFMWK